MKLHQENKDHSLQLTLCSALFLGGSWGKAHFLEPGFDINWNMNVQDLL